jgi:hypothetical protein
MRRIIALAAVFLGAGCGTAGFDGGDLTPGVSTMAEVEKDMGAPKDRRAGPDGQTILWYPRLPDGRVSYAARIGKDGKLIAIEQRLTRDNLEQIKPGMREDEVRDLLGPPQSIQWFERQQVNAWSYNAQGIVQQIYVVEVAKDGTVRRAYRYDDPQFIPKR